MKSFVSMSVDFNLHYLHSAYSRPRFRGEVIWGTLAHLTEEWDWNWFDLNAIISGAENVEGSWLIVSCKLFLSNGILSQAITDIKQQQQNTCIHQFRREGARRAAHNLPLHRHIKDERIPGFLEQGAYRIAWTEHQQWLIDNLNRLVAGMFWIDCSSKHSSHVDPRYTRGGSYT